MQIAFTGFYGYMFNKFTGSGVFLLGLADKKVMWDRQKKETGFILSEFGMTPTESYFSTGWKTTRVDTTRFRFQMKTAR